MKVRFYHWYNAVLAALLGLLGFESCGDEYGTYEYGSPWAEYQVKGTVTDEAGKPIPGIQIELAEHQELIIDSGGKMHTYHHGLDTLLTDANGEYQTKVVNGYGGLSNFMKVIVEDVDGSANGGEFQGDTLTVSELEKKQVKKGKDWYTGRYELKGDVTLKPKSKD